MMWQKEKPVMDTLTLAVIAAIAAIALYRLLHTYRKARQNRARGEQIRQKLAELRKKRDEE